MKKKPSSYARFYALLKNPQGDRDQIKETLVSRFTQGRTTSLRGMTAEEYDRMCDALEAEAIHPGMSEEEYRHKMRSARAAVLRRMQKYGIDTSEWDRVNEFTADPRVAGKQFAGLSLAELNALIPKLEAMIRKSKKSEVAHRRAITVPILINPNMLPS